MSTNPVVHTLTHTNYMDGDVHLFKPLSGKMIVRINEEEMLRIGNTDLILGYFDDNRNNTPWYGTVVVLSDDVKDMGVKAGDTVMFSFLSGKGSDRMVVRNNLYIFVRKDALILIKRDDQIIMLNGLSLASPVEGVKHSTLHYEEKDGCWRRIEHSSKYANGQEIYYWTSDIFYLEGLNRRLDKEYHVIYDERVLYVDPVLESGKAMVLQDEQSVPSDIIIPDTYRKKVANRGVVIKSTCGVEEGTKVYFNAARCDKMHFQGKDYLVMDEKEILAHYEND